MLPPRAPRAPPVRCLPMTREAISAMVASTTSRPAAPAAKSASLGMPLPDDAVVGLVDGSVEAVAWVDVCLLEVFEAAVVFFAAACFLWATGFLCAWCLVWVVCVCVEGTLVDTVGVVVVGVLLVGGGAGEVLVGGGGGGGGGGGLPADAAVASRPPTMNGTTHATTIPEIRATLICPLCPVRPNGTPRSCLLCRA